MVYEIKKYHMWARGVVVKRVEKSIDFPFDYTAVAVSGKVERSLTGLTTPVG